MTAHEEHIDGRPQLVMNEGTDEVALTVHWKKVAKVARFTAEEDEEEPFAEEALLVSQEGFPVAALEEEIAEMLDRARAAGAPTEFMVTIETIVYKQNKDVWRMKLRADPPAAMRPFTVQLIESQRDFVREHVTFLIDLGVVDGASGTSALR